jgi:hypothetical protein
MHVCAHLCVKMASSFAHVPECMYEHTITILNSFLALSAGYAQTFAFFVFLPAQMCMGTITENRDD